jgi:hypothetical protein
MEISTFSYMFQQQLLEELNIDIIRLVWSGEKRKGIDTLSILLPLSQV